MNKLTDVRRCLRLARNRRGRDFVVGDLHGHRSLFDGELARVGFDPAQDRVFSVGDLIDRGPESLETLALLGQPWFFAVLGNHELMLLNYLGYYGSRLHERRTFPNRSGAWILDAMASHRAAVTLAAERLAALPLALHVEDDTPFNVVHADLHPIGGRQQDLLGKPTLSVHLADEATVSRRNIAQLRHAELMRLRFLRHSVQVSDQPLGELPITYVGHSPVRHITVHNSLVYIDQRVCTQPATEADAPRPPTLLEHRQFSTWLQGVAVAKQGALGCAA